MPIETTASILENEPWNQVKQQFLLDSTTVVTIEKSMPFGMFVQLPGFPEVSAIIDTISYRPNGQGMFDHSRWPTEGETIEAVVTDHVDHRRQVCLRVGPLLREK